MLGSTASQGERRGQSVAAAGPGVIDQEHMSTASVFGDQAEVVRAHTPWFHWVSGALYLDLDAALAA